MNIERAVCLTLDKRIDDGNSVVAVAAQHNIDVELFIAGDGSSDLPYRHIDIQERPPMYNKTLCYPSWISRYNAYNAWLCHNKILKMARQDGVSNILMLEDDVIFEEDFAELLAKVEPFFNSNAWDMIYFGWYSNNHLHDIGEEHIYRMMGGGGFHGVLLNKHMIEELCEHPPVGPYDYITGVFYHKHILAYAIYPCIISQKSGYSYVEDGILEKPSRYKK
jgi:hypothetical protein